MPVGKTTRTTTRSVPFEAERYLQTPEMIAGFVEEAIADGDARFVPIALRTATAAIGGMAVLAERTGLSRETLYRTLSKNGNPRLDTLAAILGAFGLRLSVEPLAAASTGSAKKGRVLPSSKAEMGGSTRKASGAKSAAGTAAKAAPKKSRPRR